VIVPEISTVQGDYRILLYKLNRRTVAEIRVQSARIARTLDKQGIPELLVFQGWNIGGQQFNAGVEGNDFGIACRGKIFPAVLAIQGISGCSIGYKDAGELVLKLGSVEHVREKMVQLFIFTSRAGI
jgi:hypothetical protein